MKIIAQKSQTRIEEPYSIVYEMCCIMYNCTHTPNLVEVDCIKPKYCPQPGTVSHDHEDCFFRNKSWFGVRCLHNFCEWLFSKENQGATVVAHSNAGYDREFIYQWIVQNKRESHPDAYTCAGSRTMYVKFNEYCMRFIDRIHFGASPLGRLLKQNGIETMKGHFQYLFNSPEHYDYEGEIPDEF